MKVMTKNEDSISLCSTQQTRDGQDVIVVVDPYSSGRFYVEELVQRGVPMIAVRSNTGLAPFWLSQLVREHFIAVIDHDASLGDQEVAAQLTADAVSLAAAACGSGKVRNVVPGCEPGVTLAEQLASLLQCKWNDPTTTSWRTHKFEMNHRLQAVGLRHIHTLCSSEPSEIRAFVQNHGKFPVVVKPPQSGGTDGFHLCHNMQEVEKAVEAELNRTNVCGQCNRELIVQEYLEGEEYIVDCVSHQGKHVVSGIWKYRNVVLPWVNGKYKRSTELIDCTGDLQEKLVQYTLDVLDAVGIRYGASHSEIIICPDGPCLVETAARMHGIKGPKMIEIATGLGTHELLADVTCDAGKLFHQLYASNQPYYTIDKYVDETLLLSKRTGKLLAPIDGPLLQTLPSLHSIYPNVKPGEVVRQTRDLCSSPGLVCLVHASREQIDADIEQIVQWEDQGLLYELAELETAE